VELPSSISAMFQPLGEPTRLYILRRRSASQRLAPLGRSSLRAVSTKLLQRYNYKHECFVLHASCFMLRASCFIFRSRLCTSHHHSGSPVLYTLSYPAPTRVTHTHAVQASHPNLHVPIINIHDITFVVVVVVIIIVVVVVTVSSTLVPPLPLFAPSILPLPLLLAQATVAEVALPRRQLLDLRSRP